MEFYEEFNEEEVEKYASLIKNLEFNYNKDAIKYFSKENELKIKIILYFLADIIKQKMVISQNSTMRAMLIYVYDKCKKKEVEYYNTKNEIIDFYNYYYKSMMIELYKK